MKPARGPQTDFFSNYCRTRDVKTVTSVIARPMSFVTSAIMPQSFMLY